MLPCLFHQLTGFNCPLCGTQRMAVALWHGRITEAFHYNPLLFCVLPMILVLTAIFVFRKSARPRLKPLYSDKAIVGYLVVGILWGIVRNICNI